MAKHPKFPAGEARAGVERAPLLYRQLSEPTQSGVMTVPKIRALVKAGYGQGHRERYKPWLRIEKRDVSPVSAVGHLPSPEFGHTHHYHSRLERETLLALKWAEPYDLRDQYPVWIWPHRHPGYGLPGDGHERVLPGLSVLAEESGIRLRSSPTRVIPTLDIMSTWRGHDGTFWLVAHQCRPRDLMQDAGNWNKLERMEILRRYCCNAGIEHQVHHGLPGERELMRNLDALRPGSRRLQTDQIRSSAEYQILLETCRELGYRRSMSEAVDRAQRETGAPLNHIQYMLRIALWSQDVDHDLRLPWEPWQPLHPGGRALKKTFALRFSGATA